MTDKLPITDSELIAFCEFHEKACRTYQHNAKEWREASEAPDKKKHWREREQLHKSNAKMFAALKARLEQEK